MNLVTFYTPNYYKIFDKYLAKSVRDLGDNRIKLYSKEISKLSWEEATKVKPTIILHYLETLKQDVWYSDADSVVECYPVNGYEKPIGCHFLEHNSWYGNNSNTVEPLTGTLYFHYDPISLSFLKEWIAKCIYSRVDGEAFATLINKYNRFIQHLPLRYCYINSLPTKEKPLISCNDVIFRHYQASREMR